MKRVYLFCLLPVMAQLYGCNPAASPASTAYADTTFSQDYAIRYNTPGRQTMPFKRVYANRDGNVQVLSADGLKHLRDGQFLYPGQVVEDRTYRFMAAKNIIDMLPVDGQFVYLDGDAVFSNAWSGRLYVKHGLTAPTAFAASGPDRFLVTDGRAVHFIQGDSVTWKGSVPEGTVSQVASHSGQPGQFFLLGPEAVYRFSVADNQLAPVYRGDSLTAFDIDATANQLIIGTADGYLRYDLKQGAPIGERVTKLPWTAITTVRAIAGKHWFGTARGAFAVNNDGRIDYYAGQRWLPGDEVVHIADGPAGSVLVLTTSGLGAIHFKPMTLHEKAAYYEQQVRQRHIRNGFNATLSGLVDGDLSTGFMSDSDNDGLWTSLYLAAQAFRYATTGEQQALDNTIESLDAMARLYDVTPVEGFPARSYERRGTGDTRSVLADPERWQLADHPEWYWKATTSSDEAIGHIFAFGVVAELIDHEETKQQAIRLIDALMDHIVRNDWYLVDYDGQPTTWGRWNPTYVNGFPISVGDRKLNSSNIIGMLQTAYHFTGKAIYKEKALDLMDNHGYLENLLRPMSEIGKAPDGADDWSAMLSSAWNHSDDEMYFAGYWGLYRYAFNDTLKTKYKAAILDHWDSERPEKEGAWNIFTAITGEKDIDLEEAVWYLKEYPLDLIQWPMQNSHRKDIEPLAPNFRSQTTKHVLPPDELKISRHNANRFVLDGGSGTAESSAGDIWLFPYWMGRYLGVIDGPRSN